METRRTKHHMTQNKSSALKYTKKGKYPEKRLLISKKSCHANGGHDREWCWEAHS